MLLSRSVIPVAVSPPFRFRSADPLPFRRRRRAFRYT
jgi:hypothetical protein